MFSKGKFKSTSRITLAVRIARIAVQKYLDDSEADWLYYEGSIEEFKDRSVNVLIRGEIHAPNFKYGAVRKSMTVEVKLEYDEELWYQTKSVLVWRAGRDESGRFWCGEYPIGDRKIRPLLPVYSSRPPGQRD